MRCSVVESVTATSLGGGVSREEFRGLNSDGLGDRDAGEMMRLPLRKWMFAAMRWSGSGELELEGAEPCRTKGGEDSSCECRGRLAAAGVGVGGRKSEQNKEMFGFSGKVTICKEVG